MSDPISSNVPERTVVASGNTHHAYGAYVSSVDARIEMVLRNQETIIAQNEEIQRVQRELATFANQLADVVNKFSGGFNPKSLMSMFAKGSHSEDQ